MVLKILKRIAAAFSMYSRIPMPQSLSGKDTDRALMFLPLVGALIGLITYGLFIAYSYVDVPLFVRSVIMLIVPFAVTGGFHIDGFLDTEDALRSYRDRQTKLEILKDPHVGSFAVTGLIVCVLLMMAGLGMVVEYRSAVIAVSASYVISRALCAITSVCLKKAKDDGMLVYETAHKDTGMLICLAVQLIIALTMCALADMSYAPVLIVSYAAVTVIYKRVMSENFGGVTGDTAGYYVVVSEVAAVVAIALYTVTARLF